MHVRGSTVAAIKLIVHVARHGGELVSLERVARDLGMTRSNATKLAFRLKRGDFLISVRGPRGGVRLARLPHQLLVGDVVYYLEEYEGSGPKYLRSKKPGEADIDRVIKNWLEDDVVSILNQHSIADFMTDGPHRRDVPSRKEKVRAKG